MRSYWNNITALFLSRRPKQQCSFEKPMPIIIKNFFNRTNLNIKLVLIHQLEKSKPTE
jgi:hypothetical protein